MRLTLRPLSRMPGLVSRRSNPECGSLIATSQGAAPDADSAGRERESGRRGQVRCRLCSKAGVASTCEPVALPYVFRYLANELAGMNIRLSLSLGDFQPETRNMP